MQAFVRCLAVAALGAALSSPITPSFAADSAGASCEGLGHAQKRVVEHSYQGVDALRRYVFITRPVYGISMVDVVESLDRWRAQCARPTAATAPEPDARVATATF